MVMTGMEKLQNCQCLRPEPVQLYALENVRDDLEDDPLPLVNQLFLTLGCDLLVDAFLPTEDLDHANDVHDLSHNLNTRVRLQKKKTVMRKLRRGERRSVTHDFHLFFLDALHFGSDPSW
jgi:hypothetical protein